VICCFIDVVAAATVVVVAAAAAIAAIANYIKCNTNAMCHIISYRTNFL
jgi:hypothetical protein